MRKFLCITVLVFALMCSCGCNVKEMSTLSDLSKPYIGVYECENLTLGGRSYAENYNKFYLTLKYDGTYTLSWRDENGEAGNMKGYYKVDSGAEEITFYAYSRHRVRSYTFPMKKGVIAVSYNFGGRLLNAEFSMP